MATAAILERQADQQADTTEQAPRGEVIGIPSGTPTREQVTAERDQEQAETRQQRIDELTQELKDRREQLVAIASMRAGRAGTRRGGAVRSFYDAQLANHNKTVVELTKLEHPELELTGKETEQEAQQKAQAATLHYFEHLKELREATTTEIKGTKIGRIVEFMNRGGRFRKFVKYAAFGAIAGAAGAVVAASAPVGAAVAFGVGLTARAVRGTMRGEASTRDVGADYNKRHGFLWRQAPEDKDTQDKKIFAAALKNAKDMKLSLTEAGAAAMATIFDRDIGDQQRNRRRSIRRGLFYAALGGVVGGATRLFGMARAAAEPTVGANHHAPSAAEYRMANSKSDQLFEDWVGKFDYHSDQNPFFKFGEKVGQHDMGPPLQANPALDGNHPAGWNDLTENRWVKSPEQFASICTALGIDGMPDDFDTINGLAEHFKINPVDYREKYDAVMQIMNAKDTIIQKVPINGPIASEFGQQAGPGNMDRFWDPEVDNADPGTKYVITFTDPNTHALRTLELRCECGGQRMVELPQPVYVPEETYAPQGGGYVQPAPEYHPQGGGYVPEQAQPDQPQPEQPQGGGTPQPPAPVAPPAAPPATQSPEQQPQPYTKGSSLADQFTQLLGAGEKRPPAAVSPMEQTNPGGRDLGGGTLRAPIVDNSMDHPGHSIGTQAPGTQAETIKPSGGIDGKTANPGIGAATSVDPGKPK